MNDQAAQPGWNPPGDVQTELFQLATSVRDLITAAIAQSGDGAAMPTLERAQNISGMLVGEIANTPLRVAEPPKAGEAEAALAMLLRNDVAAGYATWLGEPCRFDGPGAAADDARAGLLRLAAVHWAGFERQTRLLGELLDRALQPENASKERVALEGAKGLAVLQYRQAFSFCEAAKRLISEQQVLDPAGAAGIGAEPSQKQAPTGGELTDQACGIDALIAAYKRFISERKRLQIECAQECIPIAANSLLQPEAFSWDSLQEVLGPLRAVLLELAGETADQSIGAVVAYRLFEVLEMYLGEHKHELTVAGQGSRPSPR